MEKNNKLTEKYDNENNNDHRDRERGGQREIKNVLIHELLVAVSKLWTRLLGIIIESFRLADKNNLAADL